MKPLSKPKEMSIEFADCFPGLTSSSEYVKADAMAPHILLPTFAACFMLDFSTSILAPDSNESILMPEKVLMTDPSDPACEDLTSAVSEEDLGAVLAVAFADVFVFTAKVFERVTVLGLRLGVSAGELLALLTG